MLPQQSEHAQLRSFCVLCVCCGLLLGGCLRHSDELREDEAILIAWWCEDVAHGLPRDPGELRRDNASGALEIIAAWAVGTTRDGRSISPPQHLDQRRRRWQLIQHGLQADMLRIDAAGLLHLHPDARTSTRELYDQVLRQENHDRLQLVALLLEMARIDIDRAAGRRFVREMRSARRQHALEAGAQEHEQPRSEAERPATADTAATPAAPHRRW